METGMGDDGEASAPCGMMPPSAQGSSEALASVPTGNTQLVQLLLAGTRLWLP